MKASSNPLTSSILSLGWIPFKNADMVGDDNDDNQSSVRSEHLSTDLSLAPSQEIGDTESEDCSAIEALKNVDVTKSIRNDDLVADMAQPGSATHLPPVQEKEMDAPPQEPNHNSSRVRVFDLSKSETDRRIKCSLSWKDLGYYTFEHGTRRKEKILDGKLSGYVAPSEICAVIGPSGSGKSTLLDVLARRKDASKCSGLVMLDGKGVTDSTMKHLSSYIFQDDVLMGVMTVRENILFAAELSLRTTKHQSRMQAETHVDALIDELGLTDVAHCRVGSSSSTQEISDGEKIRTGIACQLITLNPIIFMDEPTSGLDSEAALQVVKSIQKLARHYKLTVVMAVHQPSSELFDTFDKVLLLSEGRTLYFGDQDKMVDYFESKGYPCPTHRNPADHYMSIASVDFEDSDNRVEAFTTIEDLADEFHDNGGFEETVPSYLRRVKLQGTYARTFSAQTWILLRREFMIANRNLGKYWLRLSFFFAMSFAVATAWKDIGYDQESVQDRFSVLFFSIAILCFLSVAGIPSFQDEQRLFKHERANGMYGVAPYFIAHTMISLPYIFLMALLFTAMTYIVVDLHNGSKHFCIFLGFLFLTVYVAESFMLVVAILVSNFIGALSVVSFMNGLFMIVQGYLVRKSQIPDYWIWAHYLDYQKYALEALIENDLNGLFFKCRRPDNSNNITDANPCYCYFQSSLPVEECAFSGNDVLDEYEYGDINLITCAMALLSMLIVFRVALYFLLRLNKG